MLAPDEFSFRTRAAYLNRLKTDDFDLLVIGGGITGAGILRDAALQGLKAALVERNDFASGTSSRSSKLIHGGLRYLQQGDVSLVMEAANERRVLRRIAPYLARPVKMILPVRGRAGHATIRAGLWAFDRMARVDRGERKEMLDAAATLRLEPLLKPAQVFGSGVYYECMTDDARLVLANLRSAAGGGAVPVNYANAEQFLIEGGQTRGVRLTDMLSGSTFDVRAKVVVNAAGPWVDAVRLLQSPHEKSKLHLTKGIHLVVPHARLPIRHVVVMSTPDKRSIFAVPRGSVVYIGTTDTTYPRADVEPVIDLADAEYLLDTTNRYFEIEPLTLNDVVGAWAGLRPLIHEEGKKPSDISRKDEIMTSETGLISIAGGKLTAYRKMAERIVALVCEKLAAAGAATARKVAGESERDPLAGGETGADLDAFARTLAGRWPALSPAILARWVALYGSDAARLGEMTARTPSLTETLPGETPFTRAEIEFAVLQEMALTLTDVLERRSRLFLWDPSNGLDAAPAAAQHMARLLDWDATETERQLTQYRQHVAAVKAFTAPPEQPRAAHA